jgi:hypothetical protein
MWSPTSLHNNPYSSSISLHNELTPINYSHLTLLHSHSSYTRRISIYSSTQLYFKVDVNSRSLQYLYIYIIYEVDYRYVSLTKSLLYVITRVTPRIPCQHSDSLSRTSQLVPPFLSALTSDTRRPRSPMLPVKSTLRVTVRIHTIITDFAIFATRFKHEEVADRQMDTLSHL